MRSETSAFVIEISPSSYTWIICGAVPPFYSETLLIPFTYD